MRDRGIKRYDFVGVCLTNIAGIPYKDLQRSKRGFDLQLIKGILWKIDPNPVRSELLDKKQYL